MQSIGLAELRRLLDTGAQLVDVLPASVYANSHLPGAISIPLTTLDASTAQQLDPAKPVVVYCHDSL